MGDDATGVESELLRRFRRGDDAAFETMFGRYSGLLRRRVERWMNARRQRRYSASDILQETWVVAFRRRHDLHAEDLASFRRWLFGVLEMKLREAARHHEQVAKRSVYREVPRGERPDTGLFRSRDPTPSQFAVGIETSDRARQAMARLPADHREVLRLLRIEGLTLAEAAERMDRSREAVRKLCGRALLGFKREFESLRDGEGS